MANFTVGVLWRPVLLFSAFCWLGNPLARAEEPSIADYDALIRQARAGETSPVLEFLRHTQIAGPSAARYVNDWIAVASWARRDQEVAQIYEEWSLRLALSASSSATAGAAYRNLRRWDAGVTAYRRALSLEPGNTAFRIGLIHVLADAGQDAEALRQAQQLVASRPRDPQGLLALAYVHTAAGRRFAALEEASRAYGIAPADTAVRGAYVDALEAAGMPAAALQRADEAPHEISAVQRRRLRADAAAILVRLAYQPATTEAERFKAADAALAHYQLLLDEWAGSADPVVVQQRVRIRIDRLGALAARRRMGETLAEYDALRKAKVTVPPYALRWVASAYLYLRQPSSAAELYAEVLAQDAPNDEFTADDASGLFYSLAEEEKKKEAEEFADKTAAALSPMDRVRGSPERSPNDDWASAQEQAAQGHSFADDTPEAQKRLESLLALAPGNTGLRASLAGVYGARAWPRQAEAQLKQAEAMAPRSLGLELQQGSNALDLQEWRQAELLSADVSARFPENLQVRRLGRLIEVQNMNELRVTAYRGLSSGNPVTGNGDHGIDALLYSAPIHDNWRVFSGAGWNVGEFPEGLGHHRIQRLGGEWRSRDNTVEAAISNHDFGYGNRLGLRLDAQHDLDDHWQVGAALEKFSRDTPLRALNSNVTADSATVSVRWRGSERSEWSLAVEPMRFSDGNSRLAVTLLGRQRIYTAPAFTADLALETSVSRGVRQDVPYFNPPADLTVVPRLDLSHVIYRRYETEWRQQLQLGAGTYSERGYRGQAVYFIGYNQRLRWNDVFEAAWGISVTNRPYDGVRERNVRGTLDLTMRF